MRRGTRTMTAVATLAVALTTGIGSAAATTDSTAPARLAMQAAGVSAGAPGVTVPDRGSTVQAGDLTITYPTAASTSRAINAHTRVFDGRHFDQVVQSLGQDDVRMLTVLADASAPTRYDYSFAGHQLRELDEGYVGVFDSDTGEPVAVIEPAWAKDANGAAVRTRYEINGSTLTQVVDVDRNTAFPVVADPSVSGHWWGWQIRFNRAETGRIAAGGAVCAAVLSGVPWAGLSCRVASLWATSAVAMNKCVAVNRFKTGQLVPWYWGC